MRVFLTGATGFVGTAVRHALVRDGHQVVGFARHVPAAEEGVTWVSGSVGQLDTLLDAMDGSQAVVHLVGIIREHGEQTFTRVHVQGTEQVLSAMRRLHITRLLHMSALGAAPKAPTGYLRTKWEAEEAVRGAGVDYTIFRPSIIFGPGDGFISLLAQQLRRWPVTPVIGNGQYAFSLISIDAVASAFVQALQLNGPTLCKAFELCGPETLTYAQILAILAEQLRIRKPRVHIPVALVTVAARLAQGLRLPSPITLDELTMLTQGSTCLQTNSRQIFVLPQITLREGIRTYL
ncbi:MAG TPA: complex I NDUFA9 subunit family protein [Armatimonadota bacterium]